MTLPASTVNVSKIETDPADLPTQEVDSITTLRGTLREYISFGI
jgi:hypothetical protein